MPVLAVATLFIDYKVYTSYGKSLVNLFKKSWGWGLTASGLTVLLMPLVILFLFSKSLMTRFLLKGVKDHSMFQERKEGEYIEYTEVDLSLIHI